MAETIYSIYLITNLINDKKYVGFTCDFKMRMKDHKNNKANRPLYKAIRKYGWENFTKEIICQSKDGDYLLKTMEPYFIKKYESFGKYGYNLCSGGIGPKNRHLSDKQKERLSEFWKGKQRPKNQSHRDKISKTLKGKYCGEDNTATKLRECFKITYITGKTEIIYGINKFAKEQNYNIGSLYHLRTGRMKRHKDIISVVKLY